MTEFEKQARATAVWVEKRAKQVISTPALSAQDRKALAKRLQNFSESFANFAEFVEWIFQEKPDLRSAAFMHIQSLMRSAVLLGSGLGVSEEAQTYHRRLQAAVAQMAKLDKTTARKKHLRRAILEVCESTKVTPDPSSKFAESIHLGVCERAGVALDAIGYSPRSIQREVSAILKECSKK